MLTFFHEPERQNMTWQFDPSHSKVGFAVRHMMISKVRGKFNNYEVDLDLDPTNLAGSKIRASVETASIDTDNDDRDNHLRSEDFFNAEKYPTMSFESTEMTDDGDGNVEITGDLTIGEQTHPIVLRGEKLGPAKSPWGTMSVGFSLSTELDREQFGLTWNQALETGGVLVGKKVEITVEAEVVKQEQEEAAEA
jgi:polyisoprenoid-binding protein YceI